MGRMAVLLAGLLMILSAPAWSERSSPLDVQARQWLRTIAAAESVPNELRRRAINLLNEARQDFPRWMDAELGPHAYPIYRPDIEGVAYFELPVVQSTGGAPAGHILLSTGRHDNPIVTWSTEGASNIERLTETALRLGKEPHRYYLLAALAFAAEDNQGEFVAQLGLPVAPPDQREWRKFKNDYADVRADYLKNLRSLAEDQWRALQRKSNGADCEPWRHDYAGNAINQRRYVQLRPGEWPNNTRCYSGCPATAWAMLFGWYGICDWGHCPRWHDSGHVTGTRNLKRRVSEMIWEIRDDIKTKCYWPFSIAGTNFIWDSVRASEYVERRGGSDTLGTVSYSYNPLGKSTAGLRNEAKTAIRDGAPVVYQLGWDHKVVAYGVRTQRCGSDENIEFLINQGWETETDRWTSRGTPSVGRFVPAQQRPTTSSIWVCPPHADCAFDYVCREEDTETGRCFLCQKCSAYADEDVEQHAN